MQNKTKFLEWKDEFADNHRNHLARGYFDGDGSLMFHPQTASIRIAFSGNESFIKGLHKTMKQHVISRGSIEKCTPTGSLWKLSYTGMKSPLTVLDWLYDASIRLERKYVHYAHVHNMINLKPHERSEFMAELYDSDKWKSQDRPPKFNIYVQKVL